MRPETVWLLIFFEISENRLNAFENGETQLFNSGGVVKWAYFQQKVEYPFKYSPILPFTHLWCSKTTWHLWLLSYQVFL